MAGDDHVDPAVELCEHLGETALQQVLRHGRGAGRDRCPQAFVNHKHDRMHARSPERRRGRVDGRRLGLELEVADALADHEPRRLGGDGADHADAHAVEQDDRRGRQQRPLPVAAHDVGDHERDAAAGPVVAEQRAAGVRAAVEEPLELARAAVELVVADGRDHATARHDRRRP